MGVPRETLDRIRNALDPLDIIREAVPSLKQSGQRWRGLCPFHNERTPSFYVMPDKGLWHCFGACQEGGDVFKFVMRLEGLTFPEALRQLAQRTGIKLDWQQDPAASRASQERDGLLAVLAEAASFYHNALRTLADAEPARRHLAQRKIRPETVEKFQLGYAPMRNGFLDAALRRGVPVERLLKSGLAVRSVKSGRYHDPLQNRLIFPIVDPYGQVVGFGGRVLEEGTPSPKYLNSPETPVYTKGRQLFGLFQGRSALRERGQALIVEGYMDVIGCHQAGASYAVAPLGTALTKEQGQLLKRYVQEVILLFDPDEAGLRASRRSAEILLPEDLFVRVARVPEGKDPDEWILEKGLGAMERILSQAQDVVDFSLQTMAASANLDSLHERLRRSRELMGILRVVPNEVLRQEWLHKLARRLSLDEDSVRREFQKLDPPRDPARHQKTKPGQPEKAPSFSRVRSVEEEILQLLCSHPDVWPVAPISETLFADPRCRAVFLKLKEQWSARKAVDLAHVMAALSPEEANWFSSLLVEEKKFDNPAETLIQGAQRLMFLSSERERQALEKEVLLMLEGHRPRDEAKIARYQTLTRALKGTVRTVKAAL
jgi:DNA primase